MLMTLLWAISRKRICRRGKGWAEIMASHFTAALIFAVVTSVVFGVTSKDTDYDRFLYGLWVFGLFLVISLGAAWIMYLMHG